MRSTKSLDHIAYALAAKHLAALGKVRKPDGGIAFPLFQNPDRRGFTRKTADIEPEARQEIERLQPYGRRNPLWMLSVLDNADKHHFIRIHPARISLSNIVLGEGATEIGLADGRVFAIDPGTGKATRALQPQATPSVSLLIKVPGLDESVLDTVLLEIHDFVRDGVLPLFARFFT
jgi:hypothetical protein